MIQCVTLTITAVACLGFCITHIALTTQKWQNMKAFHPNARTRWG